MKKWKAPQITPLATPNDPLAELMQEEAAVRSPQMAPGYFDKPEDERHALVPMLQGVRELQAKKAAAATPQVVTPGPMRDNMSAIGGVKPIKPAMPSLTVPSMPAQPTGMQGAIYGGPIQNGLKSIEDPDALMNLIAQRIKNLKLL